MLLQLLFLGRGAKKSPGEFKSEFSIVLSSVATRIFLYFRLLTYKITRRVKEKPFKPLGKTQMFLSLPLWIKR